MTKIQRLVIGFIMITLSSRAQWNPDPAENNPIFLNANSSAAKDNLVMTPDGLGNVFIAWIETRAGGNLADLYCQKILANGNPAFAPAGVTVSNAGGNESNPFIVPDGAGGAIVCWQDTRNPSGSDIYAQRVLANGTLSPDWPASGSPVCNNVANQQAPQVVPLNATEFAVVWRDFRDDQGIDLYANKFLVSNGAKQWENDLQIVSQPNTQSNQRAVPDLSGGFIVTWTDGRTSNANSVIYAQRVNNAGTKLWGSGDPNHGMAVSESGGYNNLAPALIPDNTGGAVFAFGSTRKATTDANILAQRVTADGTRWTNDLLVVDAPLNQSDASIVKSGNNYVITWSDLRVAANDRNIYAQAVSIIGDGSLVWSEGILGVPVCTATGNQPNAAASLKIYPDNLGGATFIWDDARNGTSNLDIMAQRISSTGQPQWLANGTPVANRSASNQNQPAISPSSGGQIIVAWRDSRTATNAEIFASELRTDGTLPLSLVSFDAQPIQNTVNIQWQTTFEQGVRHYIVEKSADGKTFSYLGTTAAKNSGDAQQYTIADKYPVPGDNFYRLKSVDMDGTASLSKIVKVRFAGKSASIVRSFPNPAKDRLLVEMVNMNAGQYTIRLVDAAGRVVSNQTVEVAEPYRQFHANTSSLARGWYSLQIVSKDGETVKQQKIIKE